MQEQSTRAEEEDLLETVKSIDEGFSNALEKGKKYFFHSYVIQFIMMGIGAVLYFKGSIMLGLAFIIFFNPFSEDWYKLFKRIVELSRKEL